MEARWARAKELELKEPAQLPDIPGTEVRIDWDFDEREEEKWTVLRHGGGEIWRELAYWEGYERFEAVFEILRKRYGSRLKEVRPTAESTLYLYGDQIGAVGTADRLNATLRQDAAESWQRCAHELSVALEALKKDEFLIVSIEGSSAYVQFAAGGSEGMRAEAASNFYLPVGDQQSEPQMAKLVEIGWNAPTAVPGEAGSPNYFIDLAQPVPYGRLGDLAVETLRDVYGASHPVQLRYRDFAKEGWVTGVSGLGLGRWPVPPAQHVKPT